MSNIELSFEPLTPLQFMKRSSRVFADRVAVVDGDQRMTYRELSDRVARFAGWLRDEAAIASGERVAVLAPNTRLLLEAHFAVPIAGGVLVALNTRLQRDELRRLLEHSGATLLLCHSAFEEVARSAADSLPVRVVTDDAALSSAIENSASVVAAVSDERSLLSLNYTSGTTGEPKGVMYHHRGAFLQSLAMAYHAKLDSSSVFLWTLPMFHCNGWCFPWAVTAAGGTHVCLDRVDPGQIWQLIREEGVTHLNAAPTVLSMLAHHESADPTAVVDRLRVGTGGAPPSPTLISALHRLRIDVTHLYGLSETFGPTMICEPQGSWASLDLDERSKLMARQGVGNIIALPPRVVDASGVDVPSDGTTLGEIALRGNNTMLGYFRDEAATATAAPDGWFRTGDLAVMHSDGYIEIKDRSKDVIISGGENIASVEVEQALVSHPSVLEAAVVADVDEKWGEVPVAFVTLVDGADVDPAELIAHVRQTLAGFKAPKRVIFGELPKTATGKVEKYVLRDRLRHGKGTSGSAQPPREE